MLLSIICPDNTVSAGSYGSLGQYIQIPQFSKSVYNNVYSR